MPHVIDYAVVKERLLARGLVSLYHNSGAFGFPRGTEVHLLGWVGPDDPTIRPEMRPLTKQIPPPHAANLAAMLVAARRHHLPGAAWLLPRSHWHFELHDGHPELFQSLLPAIGIDPVLLRDRNDGSAIAFAAADEDDLFRSTVERLLDGMRQSDFSIVFPDAPVAAVCTLHHHRQVWWQTSSREIVERLGGQSTQSSSA